MGSRGREAGYAKDAQSQRTRSRYEQAPTQVAYDLLNNLGIVKAELPGSDTGSFHDHSAGKGLPPALPPRDYSRSQYLLLDSVEELEDEEMAHELEVAMARR